MRASLDNARIVHRNGAWVLVRPDGSEVWSSEASIGGAKGVRFGGELPDAPGPARDAAILSAVRNGQARFSFANVQSSTPDGHAATFRVFGDALQIPCEASATGLTRVSASAALEQTIADMLDCSLLTAKLADLLFAQRTATIPPHTQTPDATMVTSRVMVAQSAWIDAQLAAVGAQGGDGIVQSVGKHWIVDNLFLTKAAGTARDGRPLAINYGWHMPSPKFQGQAWPRSVTLPDVFTIQNRGWAHSIGEADYSQNCVLVSNDCVVDGQPMRLQDVLQDPALSYLANHDGVLRALRQPGVPMTAPIARQQPSTMVSGEPWEDEATYSVPTRTPDRLYKLVFGDRTTVFGDDGLGDVDDAVSSGISDATDTVSSGLSSAADSVDSTLSGAASSLDSTLGGAASSVSSFLSVVQKIAPTVAAAANTVAKISGNQAIGDLGKAINATGATAGSAAKAVNNAMASGPDADLMNKAMTAVGGSMTQAITAKVSDAANAAVGQSIAQERQITATIATAVETAIALMVATEIMSGASAGPIGAAIGAVAAAFTAVITVFTGGPQLQITNGRSFSSSDYAKNNMVNAGQWIADPANLTKIIGLTPKCFANTFNLFLANPIWLYVNQAQIGLKQPFPPDFDTGAPLDVIYQNAPGAFELVNQVQFLIGTALVHASPGLLPMFMQVTHVKGAVKNTVDQEPTHYKPIPASITIPGKTGFMHGTVIKSNTGIPKWAPGADGATGGVVYTGCPNLLTNDNVITPPGKGIADAGSKIIGQTAPADGAYALQGMLPSLTTDQCHRLFTAEKPSYDALIARVNAWLDTQKTAPAPAAFAQFNLTPTDVTAAIALWHKRHPATPPKVTPVQAVATHIAQKATAPKPAPAPVQQRAPAPIVLASPPPSKGMSLPQKALVGGGSLLAAAAIFGLFFHRPALRATTGEF